MKKTGFGNLRTSKLLVPISVTAITVALSVILAFVFFNITNNSRIVSAQREENASVNDELFVSAKNEEMRGVWIASIGNLNYPSQKGLSKKQLERELDEIVENCASIGLNTIFFQVRPCGDALYSSDIFPWSEYLSGTQGVAPDGEFDSLDYIIKKASKHGISVHAWINPFRVSNGSESKPKTNPELLCETNPARVNPEYTVAYADGKLYYNPGEPGARALIIAGITELCTKYPNLSGVHIDDYFYPYPVAGAEFDDAHTYEKYGKGKSLADFRRESVNTFVKEAYSAVKSVNKNMRFGVSPFGIWANSSSKTYAKGSDTAGLESYNSLYCDSLAWANGGYVDYLIPQVYWSFDTKAAPFDNVARWWNANLDGTGVDLYIGHAAYKAGSYMPGEIPMQVDFARTLLTCKGSAFYGYADIMKNTASIKDALTEYFSQDIIYAKNDGEEKETQINYPTNSETTEDSSYILGSSDPKNPVEINGEKVSRTKDGYFSIYTTLSNGKNEFEISSDDENIAYTITKISSSDTASSKELSTFEITDVYPSKETWISPGDTLELSCSAPSGSNVSAKIGGITVSLKPTIYSANTTKNYKEVYKGSIKIDTSFAPDGGTADIGTLIFHAQKGTKSAQKSAKLVKQLGKGVQIYAQVLNDYSYIKEEPDSSFYTDPTPASAGMRDYIVGYKDGYYKLRCGYYVSEDNVKVVKDDALYNNRLISAVVEANIEDTANNLHNSTDIRFGVLENVPVSVKVEGDKFIITFYNTDTSFMPQMQIARNPLVKSAASSVVDGNVVCEITLISAENYYGFNTVYEDGMIIFRLNNPQSIEEGDMPLLGKTILLDAGHGGVDIGAPGPASLGATLHEADLNLYITLELRDILARLGANVVMVRDSNKTVDIYSRIDIFASMIPDAAISVHHNSVANTSNALKARGYLGLYSDSAGITLANAVSDTVSLELSRVQKPTAYQMLAVARNHRYPTTLCEMSFICNVEEFQWTISPGNYERSAQALADGLLEFYRRQAKYLVY